MMTSGQLKEMGGYLSLEGDRNKDYFSNLGADATVLRTNSGKAAIYHALKNISAGTIHMPYYCCNSVFLAASDAGKQICHYHLTEQLLPDLENRSVNAQDDILFIVNFFGSIGDEVIHYVTQKESQYAAVIVDQSHCFFAPPLILPNTYNIYSCRKFFGVPDGGYLISGSLPEINLSNYKASSHFRFLLTSLEEGQNAAYQASKEANDAVQSEYIGMSEATRRILGMVDYQKVAERRRRNFTMLYEAFSMVNRFNLSGVTDPLYIFPLWLEDNIKSLLVEQRIYVPTLWREALIPDCQGRIEYDLSENTAFLPLDQRYSDADMEYLIGVVTKVLNKVR
ncbi:MAG: hypothetical protein ACOYCB_00920 [Fastidiosipilaceae bacterium]|jgi:hypothetical protein|nr:hypothetical protein [Clostridiaceae bacterium]